MNVPPTMKMKKMIAVYRENTQNFNGLSFYYESRYISGEDTPESLGMEGKDEYHIEVISE